MPLLRTLLRTTLLTTATSLATWTYLTRSSSFTTLEPTDPIFRSSAYLRNNPNRNPATQDLCVRRVSLAEIKPQLLEREGRLVGEFCRGVWGGWGYAYQRSYLQKRYHNATTASQLWDRKALLESSYEVGTQITDHFEVVSKTPSSIVVRCGGSPLVKGVRDSDGLFEMGVRIDRESGEAEFSLKSVFFRGLGRVEGPPMSRVVEWAHRLYTKLWMEMAVRHVMM